LVLRDRRQRDPRWAAADDRLDDSEHDLAREGTHEDALLERELLRALEQAIDELDDVSAEAIRAQLGRSVRPALESPTFRKRVSRAYLRLRLLLEGLR